MACNRRCGDFDQRQMDCRDILRMDRDDPRDMGYRDMDRRDMDRRDMHHRHFRRRGVVIIGFPRRFR